jgi:YesN/AraC family two-component response regulator
MSESPIVVLTSQTNNKTYYRSLQYNGNRVQTCLFCESIEFIESNKPHVVLLDCGTDTHSGLNLLREIKSFYSCTPVIFITEVTSEDVAVEAFRCGARDYLKKPVHMPKLQETLECLLMFRKVSREKRQSYFINRSSLKKDTESSSGQLVPANITSVIRYIEVHLTDQISLGQLASIAHVSKYHFCKVFKRHIGMSPLRYVALKRIKKAKELLLHADLNISEIAWEVGFNDLSNFNKHFKKYTGITPTMYKLNVRDAEIQGSHFSYPDRLFAQNTQ